MKTVTQILHSIPQVLRANEYPWCVFTTALPKSIRFFFVLFFWKLIFSFLILNFFFPVFNDTDKCGGDLNFPPTRLLAGTWEKLNLWFENQVVRAIPFGELQKTLVVILKGVQSFLTLFILSSWFGNILSRVFLPPRKFYSFMFIHKIYVHSGGLCKW